MTACFSSLISLHLKKSQKDQFKLEIARSLLLRNLSFSGQGPKNWALEYHTLMLFFLKGTLMK